MQHQATEWTTARVLENTHHPGTPVIVQGKCTTAPAGSLAPSALALGIADEEPWQPPRCVIVTSEDLFIVDRSRLWIDALHIQVVDGTLIPIPIWPKSWGVAYATNTVVQGDGASNSVGAEALRGGGGLYAEGACACASVHVTRSGEVGLGGHGICACDVEQCMASLPCHRTGPPDARRVGLASAVPVRPTYPGP